MASRAETPKGIGLQSNWPSTNTHTLLLSTWVFADASIKSLCKENSNHLELTTSSEPGGGNGNRFASLFDTLIVSVSTSRLFSFFDTQISALGFDIIATIV